ncbi:MAG: glycosyltransferase family 39 protein [Candidatus Coatesbacteria bacterium]|nr:glycosyltransferase family 39 protein [Candidatus Coatesbacteria bacterium]
MNELNYIAGLIKKHRYIIAVILFIPGFIFWVKPRISFMNEELYGLHAFRQCDTATIARNFTRYGMNPLKPMINTAGATPQIVEMESPLYPYTVAIAGKFFSFSSRTGRIASFIAALIGLIFALDLSRRITGYYSALFVLYGLALHPVVIYYDVSFMPESFAISFSIIAIWFACQYNKNSEKAYLIGSILFSSFAFLSKTTALPLIVFPVVLLWNKLRYKSLVSLLSAIPVSLWHIYAYYLSKQHVTMHLWDTKINRWISLDLLKSSEFWSKLGKIIFHQIYPVWFLPVIIACLILSLLKKQIRAFGVLLLSQLILAAILGGAAQIHDYYHYQYIYISLLLLSLTGFVAFNNKKVLRCILLATFILFFIWCHYVPLPKTKPYGNLHLLANLFKTSYTSGSILLLDRPISIDGGPPIFLYHADRCGERINRFPNKDEIKRYKEEGFKYIVELAPDMAKTPENMEGADLILGGRQKFHIINLIPNAADGLHVNLLYQDDFTVYSLNGEMNNKNIFKDKIRYLIYSGDFKEIDSEIFNKIIENKEITKQGKTATGAEYFIYDFSYKNDSHVNEEQLNILFKKKDKCSIKETDYDFGEAKLTGYSIRILPDSVIELITSWDLQKRVDPQSKLKISLLKDKYVIQDWSFYFNKGISPVTIQKISASHCFVHHLKLSEAASEGLYEMQINIETAHKSGVCIKTIELPVLLNIMKSNKEDIE